MCTVMKGDAFGFHLVNAAVDQVLFHFEIGNAVAHQSTDLGVFFEQMNIVAGAGELLCRRQTCRTTADDGDFLSGFF